MDIQPLEALLAQIIEFLPKLIAALVIFVVTLVLSSWLARLTRSGLSRRRMDAELILLFSRLVRITVLILGTIQALDQVDFNVTGFVAGLGILGFTVGFALQDVTKNFVAGILLLVQQPFDIGDDIEVAGYTGRVRDITLRTTELHTVDGLDVLIPNGDVYVKPVTNYSRDPRRRLHLNVSANGSLAPSDLAQIVLNAIGAEAGVLDQPEPAATWTSAADDSVKITASYWVAEDLVETQNRCLAAVRGKIAGANATVTADRIAGT